jgi:hypothetical protein
MNVIIYDSHERVVPPPTFIVVVIYVVICVEQKIS